MTSAFLLSKGLFCLYNKQNNTWLLVDMEFLFSCSTQHLIHSLCSLMSYQVKHFKRNSISMQAHVLFSMYPISLCPESICQRLLGVGASYFLQWIVILYPKAVPTGLTQCTHWLSIFESVNALVNLLLPILGVRRPFCELSVITV